MSTLASSTAASAAIAGAAAAAPVADDVASAPPARKRGFGLATGLIVPVVGGLIWELAARDGWINARLVPPPSAIAVSLYDLAITGELFQHIGTTLYRVAVGFGLGVGAGTLLGALTGYSTKARDLLDPTLQALRNIPSIAWVPLFILWFGIFEVSKVLLIAVGVFFPVYLGLALGIHNVDRKLVEVGRIYRFSSAEMIRRILLPAALPAFITGVRGGLGLGWMFVAAAEMMGASEGLGFLLIDGQQTSRPATIMGAILMFALIGKTTDLILAKAAARALRWQDSFKAA
ncbi:MAG: ABC transporter permease [Alphaproteobacteria bacterium]